MDRYGLLYRKYREQMTPLIPDALMEESEFVSTFSPGLEDMGLIETGTENGRSGFLYYEVREDEKAVRCTVPVFGYYAEDEKTTFRLFQELAGRIVTGKTCDFSVRLYSHDEECIRAFHMMQFGTMAEKCLSKIGISGEESALPISIRVLDKEEIRGRWDEVWSAVGEIVAHLRKSPVFYPGEEFTEEAYREFFLDDNTELIAAADRGKIAGIIEWNRERCGMIRKSCASVNVGEVFVYPAYRGTGLARQLLRTARQRASDHGADYMWVEHGTANPNARGFWNRYFATYQYELVRRIERI